MAATVQLRQHHAREHTPVGYGPANTAQLGDGATALSPGSCATLAAVADEVACTALDQDWGDDRPNILMHPPCECPRCAPAAAEAVDDESWIKLPGRTQRFRVEAAELGEVGRATLG